MTQSKEIEKALFDAVRNLKDSETRSAFLDQVCKDTPDLRARIESLLAVEETAEDFFAGAASARMILPSGNGEGTAQRSPSNGALTTGNVAVTEDLGQTIGHYQLLRRLGEGGCGVVYMAQQKEPVRRLVALKIIKLGMDTESVIARFQAERQALALMDHPNIAHVMDAGATETGRPYFVMELVRGVRITHFCNENQLSTPQRLELFIQVCHAIQHAHQKGVIHRDIKPSNVLVTSHDGVPVPKVIDFGIAKATEGRLTDNTAFTAYEQFVGTPAYMSPEQAEMGGLDVDTRSDIYSLGVLLYELLTGRTPFDTKKLLASGVEEIRRTLREREPPPPSTLLTTLGNTELKSVAAQRQAEPPRLILSLRGDLDWIVMKALEKDRRRRYETANGLAMEVQRYLNNEPVVARPPSRFYRFRKLVRRNRVVFAAVAAVTAALVFGLSLSTWLFFEERKAREEAERARANEAELRHQAETRETISQAANLLTESQYEKADELIRRISLNGATFEGAAVVRALGEHFALQNQWRRAADYFSALLKINGLDGSDTATLDYLECGCALIEAGDGSGYEHFRQAAAARFSGSANPFADRIVKISLLRPADQSLLHALSPLAETTSNSFAVAETGANPDIFQAAWQCISLALTDYRRGAYARSAEWSQRCLDYPERNAPRTATAQILLAMSFQKLGKVQDARAQLKAGREAVDAKFRNGLDRGTGVQGFWFDWVFARVLLREATALIEGSPPALKGAQG